MGPLASFVADGTLRVSTSATLAQSSVAFWASGPDAEARRARLGSGAKLVTPSLDWMLDVSAGRIELAICSGCGPWDLAPGVVLVEEAGGR